MRRFRNDHSTQNPVFSKFRSHLPERQDQPTPLIRLQRIMGNQGFQYYLQPKLKIGSPRDDFEQEADRVADEVIRMPESIASQNAEASFKRPMTAPLSADVLSFPRKIITMSESSLVVRRSEGDVEETPVGTTSYVFVDAPVDLIPGRSRIAPLVGPDRRWPLPNSTPCGGAGDYYLRFWEPNLQYGRDSNGDQIWWNDYLREDGSWYRSYTRYSQADRECYIGGYPLTSAEPTHSESESTGVEGENPLWLDLSADPETVYGEEIAFGENVEIMGWQGDAALYEDGTIELREEDSSVLFVFRPQPGGYNAYEGYDSEGSKMENMIIFIDPIELFSLSSSTEPQE